MGRQEPQEVQQKMQSSTAGEGQSRHQYMLKAAEGEKVLPDKDPLCVPLNIRLNMCLQGALPTKKASGILDCIGLNIASR